MVLGEGGAEGGAQVPRGWGHGKQCDFIPGKVEGNESSKPRLSLALILQKVNQAALKRGQRGSEADASQEVAAEMGGTNGLRLCFGWMIGRTY